MKGIGFRYSGTEFAAGATNARRFFWAMASAGFMVPVGLIGDLPIGFRSVLGLPLLCASRSSGKTLGILSRDSG
jgi:hypothetical protein